MNQLRPYQKEAIDAIFDFYYAGETGHPLVVAPTGSGKSYIIAGFCKEVLIKWSGQKILVVSHVKEILQQDYDKIKLLCPSTSVGLYSAGMGKKTIRDITVAGIQSIYNKPDLFSEFDIILVDEAHKIPHTKDGMYNKLFNAVDKPIVGFTATPYRLGHGYLHLGEDALFSKIVYSIQIKELQKLGHLCTVSSKGTENRMDASTIKKQAGDYILSELSLAFDRDAITDNIVNELLKYKQLRKMWLAFAIDIEHAEHIAEKLNEKGIKTGVVHSKMERDRTAVINQFKDCEYQCLVSVAVLTTGFDVPGVDLIVLLRPTASPVLHVQIIGRGLRPAEGKEDCLVLDFAGNLMRNGPIDAPVIKTKGKGGGEAIMKECPNCREIVFAAVRVCGCGHKFIFQHNLKAEAATSAVLSKEAWHKVTETSYCVYTGSRGIPMIKVSYLCGTQAFSEYVCVEHDGYARHKAAYWWKRRCGGDLPATAEEAYEMTDSLVTPVKILVDESNKFPNIKEHLFDDVPF